MAETLSDHEAPVIGTKVLIVCDDPEIGRIWAHCLRQRRSEAVIFGSAEEAMSGWAEEFPDLIVIDVNSSQLDAIELCRHLRTEAVVPILIFTPRNNEAHILEAYQAGADECVPKPISPALFLAKVRVWLRRSWTFPAEALDTLQIGEMRLEPMRRMVIMEGGSEVKLTTLEFRLLHLLMNHHGWVMETDDIIQRVWGYNGEGNSALLKNLVYRLRRKIEPDPSEPRHILTEAGLGYKFQAT